MATPPPPTAHIWYTPAWCAERLGATRHGDKWRARCPVHGGENPQALGIAQGRDAQGNPMTLLHCFAHQCPIEDLCAVLGIEVRNLFCMAPEYPRVMRHFPPAKSPRIARLKTMQEATPEEIAQILLEEMIVSDPPFVTEPQVLGPEGTMIPNPARVKVWELAQAHPAAKQRFTEALRKAHIIPSAFWEALAYTMPVRIQGRHPSSLTIGGGRDEA
jgi:hypothetical protein